MLRRLTDNEVHTLMQYWEHGTSVVHFMLVATILRVRSKKLADKISRIEMSQNATKQSLEALMSELRGAIMPTEILEELTRSSDLEG